jgi:hypothetical protein
MKGAEPDAVLEISPLYAADAAELKSRSDRPQAISAGAAVYLG